MTKSKTTKDQEVTEAPEVEVNTAGVEVSPKVAKEVDERNEYINQLVDETMKGKHGTGRERMLSLGTDYADVQKAVTKRMRAEQFKK